MATPNYDALVSLVRSWSNRDVEVLSDTLIGDFLRYAADKAYRQLKIPPLEASFTYTVSASQAAVSKLPIPVDLTRFIHWRNLASTVSQGLDTDWVYNEKVDIRTYHDPYANKVGEIYWARQGNNALFQPQLCVGDKIELYYYRRLPALRAVYSLNQANIDAGLVTYTATPNAAQLADTDNTVLTSDNLLFLVTQTIRDAEADDYTDPPIAGLWIPSETSNWLRDENERIVLMGALAEAFIYLDENDQIQKYAKLFQLEIDELNKEEQTRTGSGGNTQVHFNSQLI